MPRTLKGFKPCPPSRWARIVPSYRNPARRSGDSCRHHWWGLQGFFYRSDTQIRQNADVTATGRVLAAVMFTDIVDSTQIAEELGDRGWRTLVAAHHKIVRRNLKVFGGKELDTAGDGFFASFSDPGSAVRCACAMSDEMRGVGVGIRAGVHFGECEPADGKLSGITVVVGARVMSLAGAGEVLVTSTVAELTRGAGFGMTDRGTQSLKGVEQPWQVFAVTVVDGTPRPAPISDDEGALLRATASQDSDATSSRRWWLVAAVAIAVAIVVAGLAAWRVPSGGPMVPGPNTVAHISTGAGGFDVAVPLQSGGSPQTIAIGPGRVWVADVGSQTVQEVDVAQAKVVHVYGTPSPPTGLAYGPNELWVTYGFNSDPARRVDVLQAGKAGLAPADVKVPDGTDATDQNDGTVWFLASRNATVVQYVTTTGVSNPTPLAAQSGPSDVAAVSGGRSAWIAAGRKAAVYHVTGTGSQSRVETFATGGVVPSAITSSPDGTVWVAGQDADAVLSLAADGNSRLRLDLGSTCDAPTDVAATNDRVWVSCGGSQTVIALNPADGSILGSYPVDGAPVAVALDGQGQPWVVVAQVN
jgi:class 3 adenylate cyclase